MKTYILLVTIITVCISASCRKKTACFNSLNYELQFYTTSLADTIHDTGAKIIEYTKGNNFIQVVDSIQGITLGNISTYYNGNFEQQYIPYSKYSNDLYKYDLRIILYPSGNVYELSNIYHNNRNIYQNNREEYTCTNDIFYMANDSLRHVPGENLNGGDGEAVLAIKY